MWNNVDLYLGSFLILCGFLLSMFNLRKITKNKSLTYSSVLLSQNIILTCIGIAFVSRAVYKLNPANVNIHEIEERASEKFTSMNSGDLDLKCDIRSVLMSYGPLIVSLINSFISLMIDNYMHYSMLREIRTRNNENIVRQISQVSENRKNRFQSLYLFLKNHYPFIAISSQWLVPILFILSMYFINVKEVLLTFTNLQNITNECMTMIDGNNQTCADLNNVYTNYTFNLHKYITSSENYLEAYENEPKNETESTHIDSVLKNVYKIIENLNSVNVSSSKLFRNPKVNSNECMKICYIETRQLTLYMFLMAVIGYFIPITISTIILTKIHVMESQKSNMKMYVNREFIYNVLFWSPVMFDTLLSLIFCSYTMNGVRTSLFNIIANVYQVVKNFMNTMYFKDNIVHPV